MRPRNVLAFIIFLYPFLSKADTHQVTKTTVSGQVTIESRYQQGMKTRFELSSQQIVPSNVTILDRGRRVIYELDLTSQQYVEQKQRGPSPIETLAMWFYRTPRPRESGKMVNIYYETIDTGERRQFFGRTARHLVYRERHVVEAGACDVNRETKTEGWYVSLDAGDAQSGGAFALLDGGAPCRDTIVKHGSPPLSALAVFETNGSSTREILTLSSEPLNPSLFEPPARFKKVDTLHGRPAMTAFDRMNLDLALLTRSFESWFQ